MGSSRIGNTKLDFIAPEGSIPLGAIESNRELEVSEKTRNERLGTCRFTRAAGQGPNSVLNERFLRVARKRVGIKPLWPALDGQPNAWVDRNYP